MVRRGGHPGRECACLRVILFSGVGPELSSARPRRMVGRERPVAVETREIPPRPNARASQVAQRLCAFSEATAQAPRTSAEQWQEWPSCHSGIIGGLQACWKSYFGTAPYEVRGKDRRGKVREVEVSATGEVLAIE